MSDERKVIVILTFIFLIILSTRWFRTTKEVERAEWPEIITEYREVLSPEEIQLIDSVVVRPILYSNVTFLDSLDSDEAKQRFIAVMLPAILVAKKRLEIDLKRLESIQIKKKLNAEDSLFFLQLTETYKTDDILLLKRRLLTHPNSIVLAQAAIESGWGKSRFFREANNVFGVWSFDPNEPRIAASVRREDYQVYLRKYDHIEESVMDYFQTIARTPAYARFRRKRAETSDIRALVPLLDKYSERGDEYVEQVFGMIRYNRFEQYDHHHLDTTYLRYPLK
ncbi:MAG: glucosaminidase domain-containing protein [Bacteroidota bacterium]|uniref:Mannosyl-glycoprotein endo-beta-N-acetylglucosamidase-like domain-containing protein n=1 Tax=Roseivirga thermotolerans TaxID=1758176 RepID=A0ABQ3I4P6_9BACT|nr:MULTISPECIES: glucosaminidase domain-containing protein [Roseivirga]MEC7753367.1 glucosaminidase domain-containing protein [Bacteroidota bacterium]GHE63826.1 hypothetical protein GCM10011340_19070 [Roseivirga thermotolerans]|tara:strand:- start:11733 stop:12575 length:843 start_codon:yes stop_codon:yes gene_type:complete